MKLGKSILLDELLKADDVEYTDVSQNRFWIVCPACNEAIFKVVRNQGTKDDTALHYFSHYEASKAYAADCELRVGGITEREITEKAIQSRDQKLKFFITTLQTLIHDDFELHIPDDPRWTSNQFRAMNRSHAMADLHSMLYQFFFVKGFPNYSDEELISTFDHAFNRLPQSEQSQLSTTLGQHTQKRIAIDLLRHLRNPQARPSFDTLFDHSFAWYARRLENAIRNSKLLGMPTRNNDEEEIFKAMLRIMTTSRQKLRPILQKLAQNIYGTTGPDGPDNSMMTLFDSIIREMFVILIRLPYLSLLKEALKKQSPPPRPADPRTLSSCSPMST
ncbi:MAG: hypothetical protein H0V18_05745 [Pyrinomonadaceae bacterium]|nr:hypothetical protein [Pyrinomonadaceae bacterium]